MFIDEVLKQDDIKVCQQVVEENLVEAILQNMDPDEKGEFRDLQDGMEKRKKEKVQKQWQKWHEERVAEVQSVS